MNKNVGLSPSVIGLGAGIFLLSYRLFEVPPNLTLEKLGAPMDPGAVSKADSNRC
jgi:hypothetical protein